MTELVVLSAADREALVKEMERILSFVDRANDVSLADIAYTTSLTRGKSVIAFVVESVADLRERLISSISRIGTGTKRIRDKSGTYYYAEHLLGEGGGKLAYAYPGVIGYYPDMLRDLVIEHPPCRAAFDELEEALKDDRDFTPSTFVFPPAACYRHDADIYSSGAYAQALVATYAGCAALTRLLKDTLLKPDGVVGFAGGDLAALMCSGAAGEKLLRRDRVTMIRDIYGIVDKAVNHGGFPQMTMLTVVLRHPGEIDALLETLPKDKVILCVDFSPRQKTFAVAPDYEDEAMKAFQAAGARAMKLSLDRPFNTPLTASLVPAIHKFATMWLRESSPIDVYSCATAERVSPTLKAAREDLGQRWAEPVRFVETIRRMYDDGYRVFVEVGPKGLLSAAIDDTLKGRDYAVIPMNSIHRSAILQSQHAIGQLAALGAGMKVDLLFRYRAVHALDFDSVFSSQVRKESEMRLSRSFPRLTLLKRDHTLSASSVLAEPKGRGAKARERAAAIAQRSRRQRQFDFGAMNPLVSDADILGQSPGVSVELSKVFKISEIPFLGDYAYGTSQISYADPNLHGLVPLAMSVGAEIMAETSLLVAPNRTLVRIEDFTNRRMIAFRGGELKLFVKAERVASAAPDEIAVKVQIRDDSPNSAYTWPVMEAVFVLAEEARTPKPFSVDPHVKPRSVHWSSRDIYPARLSAGKRLRGIVFVELWSETGLDYEIAVPPLAGQVVFTRFPMWIVNPLLFHMITSGFSLWRSHERFAGAFSFPFRLRRMTFAGAMPYENARVKCYLRLAGVTPESHICDITVTDGNGKEIICLSGWEEMSEHVPSEYRNLILQPATSYLTQSLGDFSRQEQDADISSAFITEVPYALFERDEERWLKIVSHIVLCSEERREFREMTGSVSRRTEWLFGRIAAKEAVRRFLKDFYQARWSDADVQIWPDGSGKPHAIGAWTEYLTARMDIAIAHTSQFVTAIAAVNRRVGVDVESISRVLSDEFAQGVFTPEERELAASTTNGNQSAIRFWCAKEAVSKALGTGIRYSPKELVVTSYKDETGAITLRLEGAWLEAFKVFKGRDIPVTVRVLRDHVLATCFLPAALFGETI